MTWLFSGRVCISSLRVQRDSHPLALLPRQRQSSGARGKSIPTGLRLTTALRREGKAHRKPQMFTCEGEGEGVHSSDPTRNATPLSASPPAPAGSRPRSRAAAAGASPRQQQLSGGGETRTRTGVHDAGSGRVLRGPGALAPNPALWEKWGD